MGKKTQYKVVARWMVVSRETDQPVVNESFPKRELARERVRELEHEAKAKAKDKIEVKDRIEVKDVRRIGQKVMVPGGYHRQQGEITEVKDRQVRVKFETGEEFWYRPEALIPI